MYFAGFISIIVVSLRRARLVLEWVIVLFVSRASKTAKITVFDPVI